MIKIILISKYNSENVLHSHLTRSSTIFSIKDKLLYRNDKILCKVNYKAIIKGNRLFIFRNNIIEEYIIKQKKTTKKLVDSKFEKLFTSPITFYDNIYNESYEYHKHNKEIQPNIYDKDNLNLSIFSNFEHTINLRDYNFLCNFNKIEMYKSAVIKDTDIFYYNNKIHFLYLTYLVTLPCNDIIYKFTIYKNKKTNNIYEMIYKSINNKHKSIYKMYIIISIIEHTKVNINNPEIIKLLHEICVYKSNIIEFINYKQFDTPILIDLYRKTNGLFPYKNFINDLIKNTDIYNEVSLCDIKKIVILHTELSYIFIKKCILESREWEICKIIKILRNNQEIDKVIDILLENNCLYLLSKIIKIDIQPIMKIEKYVMESYKKQI